MLISSGVTISGSLWRIPCTKRWPIPETLSINFCVSNHCNSAAIAVEKLVTESHGNSSLTPFTSTKLNTGLSKPMRSILPCICGISVVSKIYKANRILEEPPFKLRISGWLCFIARHSLFTRVSSPNKFSSV